MPKQKKNNGVDISYIIITYILGLYGGLVSGLVVSLAAQSPSPEELWGVGIGLLIIGLVIFIIINRLLGRRKNR